jgi:hypothetical protein
LTGGKRKHASLMVLSILDLGRKKKISFRLGSNQQPWDITDVLLSSHALPDELPKVSFQYNDMHDERTDFNLDTNDTVLVTVLKRI